MNAKSKVISALLLVRNAYYAFPTDKLIIDRYEEYLSACL